MSDPSGLEYCVRDKHRTVDGPCRPVEDLIRAAKNCMSAQAAVTAHAIQSGVTMSGIAGDQAIERLTEAESRFQTLLGLGLTENQSRS